VATAVPKRAPSRHAVKLLDGLGSSAAPAPNAGSPPETTSSAVSSSLMGGLGSVAPLGLVADGLRHGPGAGLAFVETRAQPGQKFISL
jgi:hypothetical protein